MAIATLKEVHSRLAFPWEAVDSKSTDNAIFEYQSSDVFTLSSGYVEFCKQFGAGELNEMYDIAAPGYLEYGYRWDLRSRNREIHDRRDEVEEYCEDPKRYQRLVFFCEDICTNVFGFDPQEIVSEEPREYNIWRVSRIWEMECIASSFVGFINFAYESEGMPQAMTFRPARLVKKRT